MRASATMPASSTGPGIGHDDLHRVGAGSRLGRDADNADFPLKQRPPSEGAETSAVAPWLTFPISASGTPTRTLAGFSSTMENTAVPADTVWPGSTFRMLILPEIGASEPRVIQPLLFLARLGVCRVCLCGGAARSSLRVPSCAIS